MPHEIPSVLLTRRDPVRGALLAALPAGCSQGDDDDDNAAMPEAEEQATIPPFTAHERTHVFANDGNLWTGSINGLSVVDTLTLGTSATAAAHRALADSIPGPR